ncbi:hypothetical protein [Phenylobacterium sp.]|jgi:hypothetical protein|uniref:hypothetical protein n=1 Tax=Phenylobacterium sp. TaxID=1871053 RepID=UPI002F9444B0
MRSNPLDNTREFNPRRFLGFAVASLVVLAGAGVIANELTETQRIHNVRAFLQAQGYGDARVEPMPGNQCWRAAEGFAWKTPTARGTACAGPRDKVVMRSLES